VSNDPTAELWAQAVEEHVAGLSDSDFRAMVARVRPPARPLDLVSQARAEAERRQADLTAKTRHLAELPRDADGARVGGLADSSAAYTRPSLPEPESQPQGGMTVNRGQGQSGSPAPTPNYSTAQKTEQLHRLSQTQPR
jgi:hypothetical protein